MNELMVFYVWLEFFYYIEPEVVSFGMVEETRMPGRKPHYWIW